MVRPQEMRVLYVALARSLLVFLSKGSLYKEELLRYLRDWCYKMLILETIL